MFVSITVIWVFKWASSCESLDHLLGCRARCCLHRSALFVTGGTENGQEATFISRLTKTEQNEPEHGFKNVKI